MTMKYGCCLNMNARDDTGIGWEDIPVIKEAGFDYVELPLAEVMNLSHDGVEKLRKSLEKAGIPCEACNNFYPGDLRLTGENTDWEKISQYTARALERAEYLGAQIVVFGSGTAKRIPDGFPEEQGYEQIVKLLRMVGNEARKHSVVVAVEPLRKAECNIINTFEEGCRLSDDVGCENVKNLVDLYHLAVEKEPVSHIGDLGMKKLVHVHIANPQGRLFPKPDDPCLPLYEEMADEFRKIRYNGRVSCEAYTENIQRDAKLTKEILIKIFS